VAHPAVGIVAQPQGLEPARLGLLVRRLRLHLRPPPPRPVLRCRCGGIRGEQRERRERGTKSGREEKKLPATWVCSAVSTAPP
jgi:hypothetical protein